MRPIGLDQSVGNRPRVTQRAEVDSLETASGVAPIVFIARRLREKERSFSSLEESLSLGNENKDEETRARARARIVRHSVKDNEASRSS